MDKFLNSWGWVLILVLWAFCFKFGVFTTDRLVLGLILGIVGGCAYLIYLSIKNRYKS